MKPQGPTSATKKSAPEKSSSAADPVVQSKGHAFGHDHGGGGVGKGGGNDHSNGHGDDHGNGHGGGHGGGHGDDHEGDHGNGHGGGHGGGHGDDHDHGHGGGHGDGHGRKASVSVADVTVVEGGYALVTIALDRAVRHDVRINYSTSDGTASSGTDYDLASGRITIEAGQTSVAVMIPINADNIDEAIESFQFNLTRVIGARIGDGSSTVTILDNTPPMMPGPLSELTNEDAPSYSIDLLTGVVDGNGDQPWVQNLGPLMRADGTVIGYQLAGSVLSLDPNQFNDLSAGESETVVLSYEVTDGSGMAAQTLTLTVDGRNDTPVIAAALADVTDEDAPLFMTDLLAGASDVDRLDVLSAADLVQLEGRQVTFAQTGSQFMLDPSQFNDLAIGESETLTFGYNVFDGIEKVAQTLTLTIEGSNDAPLIGAALTGVTNEDATPFVVDLLADASDVDVSDILSATDLVQTGGRTVVFAQDGSQFTLDPSQFNDLAEGTSETVTFGFNVFDGTASVAQTLTITVEGRNDAPTAQDMSFSVSEDGPALVEAFAGSDVDQGTVLDYAILSQPPLGQLIVNADGTFSFDPAGAFEYLHDGETSQVSFGYTATDELGATAQAVASILVLGVNDDPNAVNDKSATIGNQSRLILASDLLSNDSDVEGDALTLVSVGNAVGGTVELDADGNVLFTPETDFIGDSTFDYTISDGFGGFDTATVTVKVLTTQCNASPIAFDDFLMGTCGDDLLPGGDVSLTYVGGRGNDTMVGGSGNDTFLVTGNDFVQGGDGTDTVVILGSEASTIDMGQGSIETLIGGSGNDVITLSGGGSTDSGVVGGGGSDTVVIQDPTGYNYGWGPGGLVVTGPGGGSTTVSGVEYGSFGDLGVEFDAGMGVICFRVHEDIAVSIPKGLLLRNDVDPDGDPLTIVSAQDPVNSTVSLQPDGNILFQGLQDFNGIATFTYTVTDGNGNYDTATVTVKVWPVNDAPVAGAESYTTQEDTAVTIAVADLLANDTDVEGDLLLFKGVGNAVGGSLELVNGIVTFTPDADFNGTASFDYAISDGHGGTAIQTVAIDVTPVNDAPVASAVTYTVSEDAAAMSLTLPGYDVDAGDTLSWQVLGAPTEGVFIDNGDGTVSFDPADQFEQLHDGESQNASFTYQVSDQTGTASQAVATIVVQGINDDPLAGNDQSATVATQARLILASDLLANDSDVEGDVLSLSSVGNAVGGSAELDADGNVLFTPTLGFVGDASFDYAVADGFGGFDTATVTVKVLPADNSAPTAVDDFILGGWGDDVLVADPGGSTLVGGSGNDTLIGGAGNDTLIVDAGDTFVGGDGNDTVIVTGDAPTTIDMGGTGVETVIGGGGGDTVVIGPDGGMVTGGGGNDSITTGSGNDVVQGGSGNDVIAVNPGGNDSINGGSGYDVVTIPGQAGDNGYTWVPGGGWVITYPGGGSTTVTSVEEIGFGDLVVEFDQNMVASGFRVMEDMLVTIPAKLLLANDSDPDGDTLSIVSVQDGANSIVSLKPNGNISFQGAPDYNGLATFTYTITDGQGGFATATVTVKVWPVNDAPTATPEVYTISEDTPLVLAAADLLINDSDVDGDALNVSSVGNAVGGSVSLVNGQVTFTPTANYNGPASFSYTVSDGHGGTVTQTDTITVAPVNDAPVAGADAFETQVNTPVTISIADLLANDTDIEGDILSFVSASNAANGSIIEDGNGNLIFTPDADYFGTASFDYTISDGHGGTATATVGIEIPSQLVPAFGSLTATSEMLVNTTVVGNQANPSVAVLTGGGSVVVWQSPLADGTYDVYSQLYDASGVALGGETLVNSTLSNQQAGPIVASLQDGGYVVLWNSYGQEGANWGVYGQRYDVSGAAVGAEFRVNSSFSAAQNQVVKDVVGLSDGGFVAVWEQDGDGYNSVDIYGRRFNALGIPTSEQHKMSRDGNGYQGSPSLSPLPNGGYVFVYSANDLTGGYTWQITGIVYNASNGGGYFDIASTSPQYSPYVAGLLDGSQIVVWASPDGSSNGVYGRIRKADGNQGSIFHISTAVSGDQIQPKVSATADGGFVVTWVSNGQDGSGWGIYGQRFTANGTVNGGEFRINETMSGDQYPVDVSARPDGGFVVTWGSNGQDGDQGSIYTRTYEGSTLQPVVKANDSIVGIGKTVRGDVLVSEGHAQGDEYARAGLQNFTSYEFMDNTANGASGYFTVNGVVQAAGIPFTVTASALGTVKFVGGSGLGTDDFTVRGFDGVRWSAMESGTVETVAITQSLTATSETLVNTTTVGNQANPSVTVLAGGGSVVVWQSPLADGTYDVYSQLYDASGVALGGETLVNSTLSDQQAGPVVASLADGGYVVTWHSYGQEGANYSIFGQRYDASGAAAGAEFRVNSSSSAAQNQFVGDVVGLSDGGFVAVWTGVDNNGNGVFGRRFNALGIPTSEEYWINYNISGDQSSPSLSALSDGGYMVLWHSLNQEGDGSGYAVVGTRFNATNQMVGVDMPINATTLNNQAYPSVAGLTNGAFVNVWASYQNGTDYGIYGRIISSAGYGPEFMISTATANHQTLPKVAATADGGFVVTWISQGQDGSGWGVYGQRYNANGTVNGGEFRINEATSGDQYPVDVSARPDGGLVVTWASAGQDGDQGGIYTRTYAGPDLTPNLYQGGTGNDTLFGSRGDDTLIGGAGADTYLLGNGSGADIVNNQTHTGEGDKIQFGVNIATDQLWFTRSGNDLLVSVIGTSDQVNVQGWYASTTNHVDSFKAADGQVLLDSQVDNLVTAMAAFAPPGMGQTNLPQDYQDQLSPVIAANWHVT